MKLSTSGYSNLSNYGRSLVAQSAYAKGKTFIAAALLLRQKGGYEFVVLHLLCQGMEIIFKAMLLHKDYKRFQPKLKGKYKHDLEKVSKRALAEHNLNPLTQAEATELAALNNLYQQHLLRYGSGYDLLVDPKTISSDQMLARVYSIILHMDPLILPQGGPQTVLPSAPIQVAPPQAVPPEPPPVPTP